MSYSLAKHVSCCEIDDRTVFLDVARDRYFLLPPELDAAFRSLQCGGCPPAQQVLALVAAGVLMDGPERHGKPTQQLEHPSQSLLERVESQAHTRPGVSVILEVFIVVLRMRRQLGTRPLQDLLASASASASDETPVTWPEACLSARDRLEVASTEFLLARRYVPIERTCLLDSLSLVHFLARRRLRAALVFGVTLHPFAAHCWAQANGLVLNETLSDANAYTPIRVVR